MEIELTEEKREEIQDVLSKTNGLVFSMLSTPPITPSGQLGYKNKGAHEMDLMFEGVYFAIKMLQGYLTKDTEPVEGVYGNEITQNDVKRIQDAITTVESVLNPFLPTLSMYDRDDKGDDKGLYERTPEGKQQDEIIGKFYMALRKLISCSRELDMFTFCK